MRGSSIIVAVAVVAGLLNAPAWGQSTALTYQGSLHEGAAPADGLYDMVFSLWDARSGGMPAGPAVSVLGVPVENGLFTVQIDFFVGVFRPEPRWLEVEVDGVTLSPRTELTSVPFAMQTRGIFADLFENIGIGTTTPGHKLHVSTTAGTAAHGQSGSGVGVSGVGGEYGVHGLAGAGAGAGVLGESGMASSAGVWGDATGSAAYAVRGTTSSGLQYAGYFEGRGYFQDDLGVGREPLHRLHVEEGSISSNVVHLERLADSTSASDVLEIEMGPGSQTTTQFIECQWSNGDVKLRVWADGDVTADGTLTGGGADFAEMAPVTGGAGAAEAGDVMMIDPANPGSFMRSFGARSTLVAGVYSTKPGVLVSEHDWDQVARSVLGGGGAMGGEETALKPLELGAMIGEAPLAVVGIVPCKVSAENGAIRPGDLLVTASIPGHAMRDENPRAGTIVGKALGSLDGGVGVVRVLVTLQ